MGVRLRDGVEIDLREGGRLVADGTGDGTATALSHAHGDHLFDGSDRIVCSDLTAALATVRRERSVEPTDHPDVELLSAGHVAGSRALLVDGVDGGRVLYTGDVCTRDRLYLDGFDPVPADTLVIEATYGEPGYVFPPHERVAERIRAWLAETDDRPVVLFGYALGRAQKLQLLADGRDRVLVTEAIAALNAPIADALGVDFDAETVAPGDCRLHPGDALVLPAGLNGADWVDGLVESAGALTAGFSGWAVDDAFRYRGDYDATFPLSDHCDFEELLALVEAVDPERVYTHHGSADAFARRLVRKGYEATALRRDQTSLSEF